jgi:hypothetical protein
MVMKLNERVGSPLFIKDAHGQFLQSIAIGYLLIQVLP